ncbi:MAG: acyl-CoA dehydrogenase family protein [Acidimicrobiales bacterium]
MDFDDTPEEAAFRAEARAWLEANAPRPGAPDAWAGMEGAPAGSGAFDEFVERCKQWQRTLSDGGWACLTWPKEYGGQGLTSAHNMIFNQEVGQFGVTLGVLIPGLGFVGPTIIAHGSDEQKARYLPPLVRADEVWCQLFSEPGAGSDLANLRTKAERDGDEYLVNGTKMWLTNGREAGLVVTLVRTDPDPASRHRGMSVLLVEKEPGDRSGGITVGPNIHKLGYRGVETVELTFDDHRVPADMVLGGEEGQGFFQMMAAVELGRINISARAVGVAQRAFDESIRYAQQRQTFGKPIAEHQAIQFKLAEMGTKLHAARLVCYDAARRKQRGERSDLEAGMAKYFCSETCWEICQEALRIHGGNGYAAEYPIERLYRDAPLMIVGEGTSEIQKLVIGRRLLEEHAVD